MLRENCIDKDGGWEYRPIDMLDFDREKEVLTSAFRDAKEMLGRAEIDLVFETATAERFGAVLAAKDSQAIHFTCHARPECLWLEDGRGCAYPLMVDDLCDLMASAAACGGVDAPGHNIEFVFVSACYSRAAGEAFVKAGVPHVICCRHDEEMIDQAAIEFSRELYRALACGWSVGDAFNLALKYIVVSPDVPYGANQVKKFLLLPEAADHSCPLFSNRLRSPSDADTARGGSPIMYESSSSLSSGSSSSWILPPTPQDIVGRELDMYKIISNLSQRRLIKIKGERGVGKVGLAAAVANYISLRRRSLHIDEIIWLPLVASGGRNNVISISASFQQLFTMLQDEGLALRMPQDSQYKKASERIFEYLRETKALIIVETRPLLVQNQMEKLSIFLNQLYRGTVHTRVLLVCQEGMDVKIRQVQSEVVLDTLTFGHTATLFGRLCPHASRKKRSERRHAEPTCQYARAEGQGRSEVAS